MFLKLFLNPQSPDEFRHIYFGLAIGIKAFGLLLTLTSLRVISKKVKCQSDTEDDLATTSLPISE